MRYQKGTFIVVPTASVVGVGAGPQALYMWLCKFANSDGEAYPSRSTLAEHIGCSERAVDGYLDELVALGLVIKEQRFSNNKQVSNTYWLPIRGANPARGVAESAPTPSQNLRTELYPVSTQSFNSSEPTVRMEIVTEKEERPKADTQYLSVFQLWGQYPLHWKRNKTEIEAAKNLLTETDLSQMKKALALYEKHKSHPYCPAILKPSDLDRKWDNLIDFNKKHG